MAGQRAPQSTLSPGELADRIRGDITAGRYQVGKNLPVEPELAEIYGATRYAVREAIKALRTEGSVRVRQGSGTEVCPPVTTTVRTRTKGADPTGDLTPTGQAKHDVMHAAPEAAALVGVRENHAVYILWQTYTTVGGAPVHHTRLVPLGVVVGTPLEDQPFPVRSDLFKALRKAHGPLTSTELVRYRPPIEGTDSADAVHIVETVLTTHARDTIVCVEVQRANALHVQYQYVA